MFSFFFKRSLVNLIIYEKKKKTKKIIRKYEDDI